MYEIDSSWAKVTELTVEQAAALLAGYDPTYIKELKETNTPAYDDWLSSGNASGSSSIADLKAIQDAERTLEQLKREINGKALSAKLRYKAWGQSNSIYTAIDWEKSKVAVPDLKLWLQETGMTGSYFFQSEDDSDD